MPGRMEASPFSWIQRHDLRLRRRMLSQMPFPPSTNVNDAYFYVEAPYGTQSTTQSYLCIGVNVSSYGTSLFYTQGRSVAIQPKVVVVPLH